MLRLFLFSIFVLFSSSSLSQDSLFLKVQFLYGSKPLKKYKETEKKWFGGMLGGHVGIEGAGSKFYSFELNGRHQLFPVRDNSIFKATTEKEFWDIMGTNGDSVKRATIIIPVTKEQKQKFDSITSVYICATPYAYALFGMRCAASTYEILAQIGVLPQYSNFKTCLKIFYPRKLRKRLLAKAKQNGWTILRKEGSNKRKWERDV